MSDCRTIHLTTALEIDPAYLKAFHRRAQANENIGSWSSLSSAQEGTSLSFSCH